YRPPVRARHLKQLINKGISAMIESLLHEISGRAACATGRAPRVPLEPAADAANPDTTDLTIDAAVAFVLERYRRTA
ncbi:MAG: (d)CMP kinase, partial [Gemmatimonadales bacterium]|nr:(d)CMP kinase [Gemmatimonadales bacterium]